LVGITWASRLGARFSGRPNQVYQEIIKFLAKKWRVFGEAAVPGRLEVAGAKLRPIGDLQIGEDSAIVFYRGTVCSKKPYHGKSVEID
jgi:hypothetical protein